MTNLSEKKLALFFSKGISLKDWHEIGSLSREVRPYIELTKYFSSVYFFTYGNKQDLEFQDKLAHKIKVFINKQRFPEALYYILLPFVYKKELKQVDILKTNQMSSVWPALLAKGLYKKKLVVRCGYEWLFVLEKEKKAFWKRLVVSVLERLAYNSADKIIFTSQKDKAFAQNRFKISSEKIEIIPNYIDTDIFCPLEVTEKKGIIYVGRLSKEKNLLNLIKAVGKTKTPLTLIGKGPLEPELRKLAVDVGAVVEFKGRIANKDLPYELNKAKVFVLPSLYEGCPKVLLEAMSCGLLCIGANVEGIKEIIQHKENGYLCNTDSESIKNAINTVLDDDNLLQNLQQAGRETILQRFSLNNILTKEVTLYENL